MSFSIDNGSDTPGRRLSIRRGSFSAPDPFAQHTDSRASASTTRLTILHVPSSPKGPVNGAAVVALQNPRMRSRSNAGIHTTEFTHSLPESGARKERVSFAFSSFSPTPEPASIGESSGSSPLTSESSLRSPVGSFSAKNRTRSQPSISPRSLSTSQANRALTPQQICDLARTSLKLAGTEDLADPTSSGTRSSPSPLSLQHYPLGSPASDDSPDLPSLFVSLPDSHYLPFIDRPSEVGALLSNDPNRRFMALLKQTFPPHLRDTINHPDGQDPADWSFPYLASFITECPRSQSVDKDWVIRIRRCIRARSEVVWERLKNVLGVPPELDMDELSQIDDATGREAAEIAEDIDEAWVEPIFPSTSPHLAGSPKVMAVSPVDMEDCGPGFGGMETIGEGEEGENAPTAVNTRTNTLDDATNADLPELLQPIRALRLCTRLSFSDGDFCVIPEETGTRSFSHGHANRESPRIFPHPERSFSHGHVRHPSTGRPEFERVPGNPLFPSNFGRLSVGPTLAANNPALRQQLAPLPCAYSELSGNEHSANFSNDHLHPPSRGSDYAITLASGSDRSSRSGL